MGLEIDCPECLAYLNAHINEIRTEWTLVKVRFMNFRWGYGPSEVDIREPYSRGLLDFTYALHHLCLYSIFIFNTRFPTLLLVMHHCIRTIDVSLPASVYAASILAFV